MNLREAVDFFLNEPKSKSTVRTYTSLLNRMVEALGPVRDVRDIAIVDIKTFEQWLHRQDYKPGTVSMYMRVIKAFFAWLQEQEVVDVSPARTVRPGKRSRRDAETKSPSMAEVQRMLDYARYDPRLFALILFLAQSGARAGEAASLLVKDVDFDNRRAWVTEKRKANQRTPSRREVIFGTEAGEAIRVWLNRRGAISEQVFAHSPRTFRSAQVTHLIGYVSTRCLPADRRVTPHNLRHFFIEFLSLGGMSDSLLTPLTGHTDASQIQFTYGPRDMLNAKTKAYQLIDAAGFPFPPGHEPEPEPAAPISPKIIVFPALRTS